MTKEEAKRILDEVIPPPEHPAVDLDHLRIAQAWLCIKEMLTVKPKCGRWITEKDEYDDIWCKCSECGYTNMECEVFNLDGFRYCPNCGAQMMDGGEND